ncbi:hypothetical protein HZH68_006600 [Vespula germanica]|uniref:Uncharacterized protein n=1 Tax=Vespula germanica TaxID=30212 RepID=A0A834KBP8_VESGE|nr:hypothetical protein HZH68_006600 [Vespula germanica]
MEDDNEDEDDDDDDEEDDDMMISKKKREEEKEEEEEIVSGNGTGGSQSKVKPLLCTALLPATGFRPTATRDFHECEPHPFPPILEAKVEEEGESI